MSHSNSYACIMIKFFVRPSVVLRSKIFHSGEDGYYDKAYFDKAQKSEVLSLNKAEIKVYDPFLLFTCICIYVYVYVYMGSILIYISLRMGRAYIRLSLEIIYYMYILVRYGEIQREFPQ